MTYQKIELRSRADSRYIEKSVEVDCCRILAQIGFAPGCEHYIAVLLHELVDCGQLDARTIQHWFDRCAKGDGPKIEKDP